MNYVSNGAIYGDQQHSQHPHHGHMGGVATSNIQDLGLLHSFAQTNASGQQLQQQQQQQPQQQQLQQHIPSGPHGQDSSQLLLNPLSLSGAAPQQHHQQSQQVHQIVSGSSSTTGSATHGNSPLNPGHSHMANSGAANTSRDNTTNGGATSHNSNHGHSSSHSLTANGIPFHNPFETQSYPLTNPPIFDYTMKFPYTTNDGITRRRRISISNGQIGQIVNHEAFVDYHAADDDIPYGIPKPQDHHHHHQHQQQQQQQSSQHPQTAPQMNNFLDTSDHVTTPIELNESVGVDMKSFGNENSRTTTTTNSGSAAGVPPPNHQLIYDNEVIYNPNDGPIPGTAAWKKERLLERNRIAASRCRQRKKQAQQVLQENISKYQLEVQGLQDKLDQYRQIVKTYNQTIKIHAKECKNFESLTLLRMLEEIDLDEEELKYIA